MIISNAKYIQRDERGVPIVTDQDGTTLIGVRRRGAAVIDPLKFHKALNQRPSLLRRLLQWLAEPLR